MMPPGASIVSSSKSRTIKQQAERSFSGGRPNSGPILLKDLGVSKQGSATKK
jgi:hypothetical protein